MVIVKLFGGLGNQMSQYAMGRRAAFARNVPLKLDIGWFNQPGDTTSRNFDLSHFRINKEFATQDEIKHYKSVRKILGRDLYEFMVPLSKRSLVREKLFEPFNPKFMKLGKNIYLEGYWFDERYFKDIKDIIYTDFTLSNGLSEKFKPHEKTISVTDSISIHIRRGDYINNPVFKQLFAACSIEYYRSALEKILPVTKKPHLFIFSDEIEWAEQYLRFSVPATYISNKDADSPNEEMILMSMCKHNIIANSSFSWWGAWLNKNPYKIVVAPEKWLNSDRSDIAVSLPESWLKL